MRRLLSILLLALFGLPLVSLLFALSVPASPRVMACCRKGGMHQCALGMQDAATDAHTLRAFRAKCPFAPQVVVSAHADLASVPTPDRLFTPPDTHAGSVAQTESRWRVARERSRQKRGPPSTLFS